MISIVRFLPAVRAQDAVWILLVFVNHPCRSCMIAVFRTGLPSRLRGIYALAFDDETIDDARKQGVRSSRNGSVTLTVDKVLRVLGNKHGKVWPGAGGR